MSKISCCLRLGEVPLHLYQIIAGYHLLKRKGIIELSIEKAPDQLLPYNMMEVEINNQYSVLYDLNDGYDNLLTKKEDYVDFMDRLLERYDICFKRSFSSKYNRKLKYGNKVCPLGLNYMVTIPGNAAHLPQKEDPRTEKIKKLIRMLPFSEYYNGHYKIQAFEDTPNFNADPKILFMARLWDINGEYSNQLSNEKKEERNYINNVRANCIRLLKREFGSTFFGGVSPSPYANKYYSDIVIEDKKITNRNYYIRKVKDSSICIATMGLHESIGWKFAEYIAASKAIVTEELHYEVPGNLNKNENYLDFSSPEHCLEQVHLLMKNVDLRKKMMINNFNYYHKYVRPDQIVLNSIINVLESRLGGVESEATVDRFHAYI
ncbi:glycosyltransferase family 1 protein [Robertmurraya sp. GLU-23]